MTDRPPLPESDDPFEFLGVELPCAARELRRAYHRWIRWYRPEHDPEAFQQIRAKFDEANEELRWLIDDGTFEEAAADVAEDAAREAEPEKPVLTGDDASRAEEGEGQAPERRTFMEDMHAFADEQAARKRASALDPDTSGDDPPAGAEGEDPPLVRMWASEEDEGAPSPQSDASRDAVAEARALFRVLWKQLAEGEAPGALQSQVDALPSSVLVDPEVSRQRLLFDELLGRFDALPNFLDRVVEGGGPRVAGDVEPLLSNDDLVVFASHEALSWRSLRGASDRAAAMHLLARRMQQQIMSGDWKGALVEISDDVYIEDAVTNLPLDWIARRVLALVVWERPRAANRLMQRFGEPEADADGGWTAADQFEMGLSLASPWSRWCSEFPKLKAMRRFLPVAAVEEGAEVARRALEVYQDLKDHPRVVAQSLDRMDVLAPSLLDFTMQSMFMLPGVEEDKSAQKTDDRSLRERIARLEARIRKPSWVANIAYLIPLMVVLAVLAYGFGSGILGAVLTMPLALLPGAFMKRVEEPSYEDVVYPRIAALVIATNATPARIAGLIRRDLKRWPSFTAGLCNLIAGDRVLQALHFMGRLDQPLALHEAWADSVS